MKIILIFIVLKPEPDEKSMQSGSSSSPNSAMLQKTMNGSSTFATNNKFITANNLNDSSFIPLEETTPLFGEIFNELILPDSYCTLLSDEMQSIDSQAGKINIVDDFINYSDGTNGSTEKTSNTLASNNLSKVGKCLSYSSNQPGVLNDRSISKVLISCYSTKPP